MSKRVEYKLEISKKSQSQIITTVLIILMVLGAIVIVWNVVNISIKKSADQVSTDPFTSAVEIKKSGPSTIGGAVVVVQNKYGKTPDGLIFSFMGNEGEYVNIIRNDTLPSALEYRTYIFNLSEVPFIYQSVTVIPLYNGRAGIEVDENPSDKRTDPSGKRKTLDPKDIDPTNPDPFNLRIMSWWKLEDNPADDYITDSQGDNHGDLTGLPLSLPGVIGNSLEFDGDGSVHKWVQIPVDKSNSPNITPSDPPILTISVWIMPYSYPISGYRNDIIQGNGEIDKTGYLMGFNGYFSEFEFTVNDPYGKDGLKLSIIQDKIPLNHWTHISGVISKDEMILFINGTRADSLTHSLKYISYGGGSAPNAIIIGSSSPTGIPTDKHEFHGRIDEVMFFNRSLTDAEISAIYNSQKP